MVRMPVQMLVVHSSSIVVTVADVVVVSIVAGSDQPHPWMVWPGVGTVQSECGTLKGLCGSQVKVSLLDPAVVAG